jgi:DNA-binding NarL/FixJ family response regulator
MLDDLGLVSALEWYAREVSRSSETEVEVKAENVSETLPDPLMVCIYRVVQEAVNNAQRHARAKNVTVELRETDTAVQIQIKDDGTGFDGKRMRGIGLLGMEERVKRLGGTLAIDSAPGAGTTIRAELLLPYGKEQPRRMKKIRILLADDHTLMRGGLRLIIEQHADLSVVGEAEDSRQAVALAASLKPDVAVLDIGVPNLNGIEAAKQITERDSGAAVVVLSMHRDESYILRALKAGVRGYLLKDSAESDLARAIRAVAERKSFFSPAVSKVLLEDYMRKLKRTGAEDSYDLLTPREREILQLVAEGKSNKEVAAILNLSVHTVETHRSNIMEKLKLKSLPELILYAVRKGIIALPHIWIHAHRQLPFLHTFTGVLNRRCAKY